MASAVADNYLCIIQRLVLGHASRRNFVLRHFVPVGLFTSIRIQICLIIAEGNCTHSRVAVVCIGCCQLGGYRLSANYCIAILIHLSGGEAKLILTNFLCPVSGKVLGDIQHRIAVCLVGVGKDYLPCFRHILSASGYAGDVLIHRCASFKRTITIIPQCNLDLIYLIAIVHSGIVCAVFFQRIGPGPAIFGCQRSQFGI